KTLGCEADYSVHCLDLTLETIQVIEGAPFEGLHLRRTGFQADGAARVVRTARELASALLLEQIELEREFDIPLAFSEGHSDDLIPHALVIEESGRWQRL